MRRSFLVSMDVYDLEQMRYQIDTQHIKEDYGDDYDYKSAPYELILWSALMRYNCFGKGSIGIKPAD